LYINGIPTIKLNGKVIPMLVVNARVGLACGRATATAAGAAM
jgi:hypothetical protein